MASRIPATKDEKLLPVIQNILLFNGIDIEGVKSILACSKAEIITYEKGEMIFTEGDRPSCLPILLSGSVNVARDTYDGKRNILSVYEHSGELFGYEKLLQNDARYGIFGQAQKKSKVLMIPKDFMTGTCERNCEFHSMLISNMLFVMATKTESLHSKLEIMTCGTLRQKIIKMIMLNSEEKEVPSIKMNRQEMAEYLNVARPSLSRELMKMVSEGLIDISGKTIKLLDPAETEKILGST